MIKIDKKYLLKNWEIKNKEHLKYVKILKTQSGYKNANFEINTKIILKQGLPHPEITIFVFACS